MSRYQEQVDFLYHKELGGLEMVNAQYRHKNFNKHCHESYTVSVIKTGVQKFYRSGGDHFAPEHSIILVNADDVHTGQAADGVGWSYQAIYPMESHFQSIAQSLGWSSHFAPYFNQPVVFDPELAQQLRQLFSCLEFSNNKLHRESLLYHVLSQLMIKHGSKHRNIFNKEKDKPAIYRAKEYLHEHITENISLEELSKQAGMSMFHLVREFQQQFGLPPHAYQIQLRLKTAKQLLKQGRKVIETSLDVGFHDQSHFHRHFKKAMGISPGKYALAVA